MVKVLTEQFPKNYKGQGNRTDGFYMDKTLMLNLDVAKRALKKDFDLFLVVDGSEGCLAGDSMIQVSRGKVSRRYSIKWLWNQYHNNLEKVKRFKQWNLKTPSYIRSFNGKEVKLYKIKDVHYSGIKRTFQLELENGKQIRATNNHKFITRDGWKELKDIKEGEEVMCDTLRPSKKGRRRVKFYDVALRTYYHPYGKRIEVHRLIYEAHLNNLTFLEYMDIILNEPERSKKLIYVNTVTHLIHHKDGFHYNNSLDNLELIKKEDHIKFHNNYGNFSQGIPLWSRVVSITELDEEDTYDIECEDPHHNFVANGIIVHNSGKSVLAQQVATYLDPGFSFDRICFRPDEFKKSILAAKKFEAVVFDESLSGLGSRSAMSGTNKMLVDLFAEIRQRNLAVIIVLPSFFELDKYAAIHRSTMLINVYHDHFQRGFYRVYSGKQKKYMYLLGKKTYNYRIIKTPAFIGRFTDFYCIDKEAYKKKKAESLRANDKEEVDKKSLKQRKIERMLYYFAKITSTREAEILSEKCGLAPNFLRNFMRRYDIEDGAKELAENLFRMETFQMPE